MKQAYLKRLESKLHEFEADRLDIRDILIDYEQLYDDALNKGMSDDEVYELLGNPDDVAYELLETLKLKRPAQIKNKFVALMPFVAVISYMLLGLLGNLWNPGWLVFLLIPMSAIILHKKRVRHMLTALAPFIAVIAFIILGEFDLWHPGWLVFLIIPLSAIILNTSRKDSVMAATPFLAVIAFVVLGLYGYWNPGWLVFMLIPMVGILYKKSRTQIIVYESLFVIAIATYLFVGYTYGEWFYAGLAFLLPMVYGILIGDVLIIGDLPEEGPERRRAIIILMTIFLAIVIFIVTGILFDTWSYMWQIFLMIPIVSIIVSGHFRFTAIAPFVATILFFTLGYFFGAWTWAWLVFLLIPMTAIIEG
ncbi:MAG: DUF1700 domain-containing protein [Acholeplasmataceae bacterium]|nr:DUF1700 domain-containing protein [Acholeplasmataceae bacterium]